MKLIEITDVEQQTVLGKVKDWFVQYNQYYNDAHEITMDANGLITYRGGVRTFSAYPTNLPPVHRVIGDVKIEEAGNTFFKPDVVGGSFEIHAKRDANIHIKASDLPSCDGSAPKFTYKRFVLDGRSSTIDLDDISALQTYTLCNIGGGIVSGISSISQLNCGVIHITDNFEGIPSKLSVPEGVVFITISTAEKLNTLGKTLKSIDTKAIFLKLKAPGPILKFFKNTTATNVHLDVEGHDFVETMKVSRIIVDCLTNGNDIFEMQEQLIEQGFSEYAR